MYVLILTKNGLGHISGHFFHGRIGSPCHRAMQECFRADLRLRWCPSSWGCRRSACRRWARSAARSRCRPDTENQIRVPFLTSPLEENFDPQGQSCPPGVTLSPRGEVIPWGWNSLFAHPFF
jgi:hypothetical protein